MQAFRAIYVLKKPKRSRGRASTSAKKGETSYGTFRFVKVVRCVSSFSYRIIAQHVCRGLCLDAVNDKAVRDSMQKQSLGTFMKV